MIGHYNAPIVNFKDTPEAEDLEEVDLSGLPVVLRVGAINYNIGAIQGVRKGRDEFFGDVVLELEGTLELDEDGKAVRFVYRKEKSG